MSTVLARHTLSADQAAVIPTYLFGCGLQMLAKRVRPRRTSATVDEHCCYFAARCQCRCRERAATSCGSLIGAKLSPLTAGRGRVVRY